MVTKMSLKDDTGPKKASGAGYAIGKEMKRRDLYKESSACLVKS